MINCIIYEDNEMMQLMYREAINYFFAEKNIKIRFQCFCKYQANLENKIKNIGGNKIFILDVEVPGKSGLDFAREIRNGGDWISPMIVVTSYEHLKSTSFTGKMLMLDFISKKENIKKRLQEALEIAYNIFNIKESYTFQYNGELYHVDYQDILYFEKDNNDNYMFLYTKLENYKIKESINSIEKLLRKKRNFYKINRSCIVNINNITKIDSKKNTLYFDEYSTNILTKENCDTLKNFIREYQINS